MAEDMKYEEIQCILCFEAFGWVGSNDEIQPDLEDVPFLCNRCKEKTD